MNPAGEPEPAQVVVDGPTLRSAREGQGVPLRRIARTAGMSHGHLSKVERGEHGRPVTPAILAAYQKWLGFKIADAVAAGKVPQDHRPKRGPGWQPGQLTDFQRRAWRAQVAAVGAGGSVGMPLDRLLASGGRVFVPQPVSDAQVVTLEQVVTGLEESASGDLAGVVAHQLLGWAIRLRAADNADPRVQVVVARLARCAAVEAYQSHRHESARAFWLLGLDAAAAADHPGLRALILADIATQHVDLGYHDDAVMALRAAEGDERIGEDTRTVLKAVRARVQT